MRHPITYGIIIIPLIIALIRANNHPYFATNTPYQSLLALNIPLSTGIIASVILASTSLLLILYLFRKINIPLYGYLILLLSPPVLALAILDPTVSAIGLLAAIAFWKKQSWISVASITLACWIHPSAAVLGLSLALYFIYKKKPLAAIITAATSVAAGMLSANTIQLSAQFAELQIPGAISIIAIILAVFACVQLWNENTAIPLLIVFLVLLGGILFSPLALITSALSAALAGYALSILNQRKWSLTQVKTVATYFVLLGLLFAAVASTSQAIQATPHSNIQETAQILNSLTQEPVAVLSTQKEVLAMYGVDAVNADALRTVQSTDELADKATTYIVIEQGYPAQRITFLLENSRSFALIEEREHKIYRYIG